MGGVLETGVDIVEIDRVAELARRYGDRFGRRVFTPEESSRLNEQLDAGGPMTRAWEYYTALAEGRIAPPPAA